MPYLEVAYEDIKEQVLTGLTDEEVLTWCYQNGRTLTDEQKLIYNSFMSKRGWRDDETAAFIPEMIEEYGIPELSRKDVLTDFDLIEIDEGRWQRSLWRDAWTDAPTA